MNKSLKKFLGPDQIEAAIDEVKAVAKAEEVDIALAGGVAMQFCGSDRLTTDIDFLSSKPLEGITETGQLAFGGVKGYTSNDVPVDLIIRDDQYEELYREALYASKENKELGVNVVTPEHLAAMKLAAGRDKDETDLHCLISTGAINILKTKEIILEHLGRYAVDAFQSFVDEAEWKKSKERR